MTQIQCHAFQISAPAPDWRHHLLATGIKRFLIVGLLMALVLIGSACQNTQDAPLPIKRVNVQVYLNTIEALPLKTPPNYIYIKDEGLRGIVLYSDARDSYYALDRNCTYRSNDTCAQVSMDPSLLFLTCRCCGSRFGTKGEVQNGVAVNSLRRYNVSQINPGVLLISN